MSGPAKAFTAGVCAAALVVAFVPLEPIPRGAAALVAALVAGIGAAALWTPKSWLSGGGGFICDRCKYDNERDCSHPERPNARRCDDFKSRES